MPRTLLLLVFVTLLAGCSTHSINAPVGDRSDRPAHIPAFHTVKQGDTLYSVAFLYGFTVEKLAAWNGIKPPYTIYKRQRLRLRPPPARVRRAPTPEPVSKPVSPPVSASRPKPRYTSKPVKKAPSAPVTRSAPKTATATSPPRAPSVPAGNTRVIWSWPAEGPLLARFSAGGAGKKGINIGGKSGQRVRAAAAGKVVYSGSGLGAYGRLIIIKHNKDFLSAYAHNRKLVAKEGQWVKKGEVIAWMGSSGTDRIQLHFEIRKQGKPVDPLRYLPRR